MSGHRPAEGGTGTDGTESRHEAVRGFFAAHRQAWLDRYRSDSFDARNYRRRAEVARVLLSDVPRRGGRLLEVGCGAGVQAAAAHHLGWDVCATDLTLPLLHQAKKEFAGPRWVAATAEDLPYRSAAFDVVLMLGVIGYVDDPATVLRGVCRVLTPGGHLIVSWARKSTLLDSASRTVSAVPDRIYLAAKRALTRRSVERPPTDPGFYASYNRFWDRQAFVALLDGTGFRPQSVRGVNFGQFRFMDHALWPPKGDFALSAALETVATLPGFGWLEYFTRTQVAIARRA